jgi:hypothetical protein
VLEALVRDRLAEPTYAGREEDIIADIKSRFAM